MELEGSSGARRVTLPMQLYFFCLSKLRFQRTAAQEVNTVWEAQLPALGVGFKVHHQGWKQGRCMKRDRGKCQDTHREHLQSPQGAEHIWNPTCEGIQYHTAVTSSKQSLMLLHRQGYCPLLIGMTPVPQERRTKIVLKNWLTNVWWVVCWVGCEDEARLDLHAKKRQTVKSEKHYLLQYL